MPHISKILVPVDIHESATAVIRWAAFLAQTLDSRLTLLHVNESAAPFSTQLGLHSDNPEKLASMLSELHSAYDQTAKLRLTALAEQTCEGLAVDLEFVTGRAKAAIVEQSKAQAFDLIVMGTHGRGGIQRLLLGSVTESVVRHAVCPVVTLKHPADLLSRAN